MRVACSFAPYVREGGVRLSPWVVAGIAAGSGRWLGPPAGGLGVSRHTRECLQPMRAYGVLVVVGARFTLATLISSSGRGGTLHPVRALRRCSALPTMDITVKEGTPC